MCKSYMKKTLSQQRIEVLNSMGFVWAVMKVEEEEAEEEVEEIPEMK